MAKLKLEMSQLDMDKPLSETVQKKPNSLFDFLELEKIRQKSLMDLNLKTLKELYLLDIRNGESLLWLAQTKNDNDFDGYRYTDIMIEISDSLYNLPLIDEDAIVGIAKLDFKKDDKSLSDSPLDELFMWSILTFSGKDEDIDLIKYYWTLTSKPIVSALAAMVVYNRLLNKSFVNREFKESVKKLKKEFEDWASGTLRTCFFSKPLEAQDLILRQNKLFLGHTALELAIEADAEEFMSTIPVQQLLTDIWHGKINPYISSFKIIICLFFWPLILCLKLFKYDFEAVSATDKKKIGIKPKKNEKKAIRDSFYMKDLPFRVSGEESIFFRFFYFLNAPIIKYVHHAIVHFITLLIFCYLMLFDLWPLPSSSPTGTYSPKLMFGVLNTALLQMPVCELIIVCIMAMNVISECREAFNVKTFGLGFLKKIFYKPYHHFRDDPWNIFEIICLLIFFLGVIFRVYPTTSDDCFVSGESCTEVGRICYSAALVMYSLKTIRYMVLMPAFGPKYQIIIEMIKKLVIFICLLSLLVVPYAVVYRSIMEGTEEFKLSVIAGALYKMLWTVFLEIKEIIAEIKEHPCQIEGNSTTCIYTVTSSFLYVSFPMYVLACNILLLNLIIAVFAGIVEELSVDSEKVFRLMRYSNIFEFEHKTILPPPLNFFEYIIRLIIGLVHLIQKLLNNDHDKNTNFAIKYLDGETEEDSNQFEIMKKEEYLEDAHLKEVKNKKDLIEKKLKLIEQKISVLQQIMITSSEKAPGKKSDGEKLDTLKDSVDYLTNFIMTSKL